MGGKARMKELHTARNNYWAILRIASIVMALIFIATGCIRRGDAPAGNTNWVLKESTERPDCVTDEVDVPVYKTEAGIRYVRTPDDRFKNLPGYPFMPHYVTIDGLRMHYVDEGPGKSEVVLMLHGQPSWSYLYRRMIPPIAAAGYRVIAVDLVGMGRSDKPIAMGMHTYEQHIKWVRKFIKALKLKNITLFCQDWGGLIGLRIAGEEPHLFSRVVAANTTLPVIEKGRNPFRIPNPVKIDCEKKNFRMGGNLIARIVYSDYREKLPDFVQKILRVISFQGWINYALTAPDFTPSRVVEFATVNNLTNGEAAAYDAPYPSMIYKAAVRTLPSMIAAVEDQNVKAWKSLGKFKKPFLFLAGEQDKNLGSKENQNMFINYIPGAKGQPHERFNAHHFIQEDVGEILADRVIRFIEKNPL
jgi:haloalkane dehalogenase